MHIPASTYRVQLHKEFNFKSLENILDYIADLGITTIYAAPIFKATPGSMHGYDVTDPHMINPEIGTIEEFKRLIEKAKSKNLSWIQDIVPNHMAFHPDNWRLMDVLERGPQSPYSNFFDINWNHQSPHLLGKVQVPFLGKPLQQCIEDGELKIGFGDTGFTVDYFGTAYPLSTSSWSLLLKDCNVLLPTFTGSFADWKNLKIAWVKQIAENDKTFSEVLSTIDKVNSDRAMLQFILAQQYYVLTFWKDSEREIGYRRFFTVNELICLKMEEEDVFNEYHSYLLKLYNEKLIQGIRVDHIDGLYDPSVYLKRLRSLFGEDCYIIAEKILEAKETMPSTWPLQGTSGYEFLSFASQLMTNRTGAKKLRTFYRQLVPSLPSYHELVERNKRMILEKYMAGEWDSLATLFTTLGLMNGYNPDRIKEALAAFMIGLPVYRIYPEIIPLEGEDSNVISEAFVKALKSNGELGNELNYIKGLFTNVEAGANPQNVLKFLQRLMQFTGPLTAKGVEDTTFYVYNALISHDEVGDAPSSLGISIDEFHKKMQLRQASTPLSLNATATHDTKRGEDSRLRLNVLCDFPDKWIGLVAEWMKENQKFHKRTSKGILAPVVNDEYFIYQSILGGLPADFQVTEGFIERIEAYQVKVLREAKVHSDWADPDEEYEQACLRFIRSILEPESKFLQTAVPFLKDIVALSNRYSLAQSLIKITSPGIPDTYQGAGLWDLSFVDPDNRRPVDYDKRKVLLDNIKAKAQDAGGILFSYLEDERLEGIEKLFVTWKALNFRKDNVSLFSDGGYRPLQSTGKEMVTISYARSLGKEWAVVVIPLRAKMEAPTDDVLENEEIVLPEGAPSLWRNVFTGDVYPSAGRLSVADCCEKFPIALLTSFDGKS